MLAQHDGGDHAGGDQRHGGGDTDAVGAERGDEHEQHAARHQRFGAGIGPECERVGEEDRSGDTERCEHVPAGEEGDRSDGGAELLAHQIEFEPEEVPGLGGGQEQRVRVPVEHRADDPEQSRGR